MPVEKDGDPVLIEQDSAIVQGPPHTAVGILPTATRGIADTVISEQMVETD